MRKQGQIIRELTRSPRRFSTDAVSPDFAVPETPFMVPRGAKVLERNAQGEPIAFSLPEILPGSGWEDQDFDMIDWGELIDEYGEEEEDSYGEDAG